MSSRPDSKKRKRDDDDDVPDTLVTFMAPQGRTFIRVFEDQSFDDIKEDVKQKLGLSANEKFTLVQLKDGREADLDDDRDFEAFRSRARFSTELSILIRVGDGPHDLSAVPARVTQQPAPYVASVPITDRDQRSSAAATKSKSKPAAATLKYTPLARSVTDAAEQPMAKTVVPTQPIAGPSSRPPATSVPAEASSSSLPKKQTAKKSTGLAAKVPDSLHTSMPPPPVPPTAEEDPAAKKRRKKTKRLSDSLPSPTPELSLHTPSTQPTPSTLPEKRKAEATPNGAESSPEEPPKKKTKKKSSVESASEPPTLVQPDTKRKGRAKEPADDVSTETGAPSETKGKSKEAKEKNGKKKNKSTKESGLAEMTVEKQAVWDAICNFTKRGAAPAPQLPSPTSAEPSVTPEAEPDHSAVRDKSKSSKARAGKASSPVSQAGSAPTENQTTSSSTAPTAVEPSQPKVSKAKAKAKSGKAEAAAAQALAATLDKAYAASTMPTSPSSPEVSKKKAATKKGSRAKATPCPVCLNTPFHLRNQCPVILAGSQSIEARIEELQKQGQHVDLVGDLKEHLERARQKEVKAAPPTASQSTTSKATVKPAQIVLPPAAPPVASEVSTPVSAVIPSGSAISKVAVEGKDDGSSSDSSGSDDGSEDVGPAVKKSNPRIPSLVASNSSSVNKSEAAVEALLRGPAPRKSILAQIPSTSDSEEDDDDEDQDQKASDEEGLASDREEQEDKAFRKLSRQLGKRGVVESSDDESVDDVDGPAMESKQKVPVELPPSIPRVTNSRPTVASSSSSESVLKQIVPDDSAEPEDGIAGDSRNSSVSPSVLEEQVETAPTLDPAQSEGEDGNEPSNVRTDRLDSDNVEIVPSSPIHLAREPSLEVPVLYDDPIPEDPTPEKSTSAPTKDFNPEDATCGNASSDPDNDAPARNGLTTDHAPRISSEDPQDPIEPAEDLEHDIPKLTLDDPIEFDPPVNGQQSPPLTPLKSALAKRMKDRHGQLDSPKVLPALASQLRKARASQDEPPAPDQVSEHAGLADEEPQNDPDGPRRSLRARKATPDVSVTSQAAAPDAAESQQRTRGRPRLSQEEKERRNAERKAETAARRQAVKEQKKAEREAEKERKAAERREQAEAKARSKANGVTMRTKKAPRKKATPEPPESEDEVVLSTRSNEQGQPPNTPLPSQLAAAKRLPASIAKWEVLADVNASPSTPGGDITMIDELRSSSPDIGMNGEPAGSKKIQDDEDQEIPDSQESVPKAQVPRLPSTSLFFPSDTQLPDSQSATQNPFECSFTTNSHQSSSPGMSSKFKKPVQPASMWQNSLLPPPANFARKAPAPFKRLSDIMSSQDVLSLSQPTSTPAANAARRRTVVTAEERRESMYGSLGNDASDSEDDTDSDEDNTSHIPKSRRAGQKSKKELLVD